MHHDGDHYGHDQKSGAAAHVDARELGGVFGREGQTVLKAMDRLMLGAVVSVETRHVGNKADASNVSDEHYDSQ